MIELRGTIRNLAKWFRLCERLVDRSPRMERNTDIGVMVRAGSTPTAMLTRGQMARALREGSVGEARLGGTGGGAIPTAMSRVDVRKYINYKDLRTGCGCVTMAMLMAATITVAPTAGIPRNSANPTSSAPKVAGSIPRTPSPFVGDGNSVHPYVSDVNQGHQKKMLNKITSVTAAAVVGIATTVAGAADLLVPAQYPTIQAAIDAAQTGDSVLVSPGTYYEQVNLSGKQLVLHGVGGAAQTILDGQGVHTVVIGANEPLGCEVSGFTIQNGNGYTSGGVLVNDSSVRVHHCTFRANTASDLYGGAGFRSAGGASAVEDCLFTENVSPNVSTSGGWFHFGSGTFSLKRCVFSSNLSSGCVARVNSEGATVSGSIEDCSFVGQRWNVDSPWTWGSLTIHLAMGNNIQVSRCKFTAADGGQDYAIAAFGCFVNVIECDGCGFAAGLEASGGAQFTVTESTFNPSCADCNLNSTPDLEEIVMGAAADSNRNSIPDTCECIGDIDLDGAINGSDLGTMLAYWGPVTTESVSLLSDLNADGFVNGSDLGALLAHWGACQG